MKINHQPIHYSDIVVLMRSTTAFLTFKKVFDAYHIPNHIVLSQGFMNANEIENMIAFLKAINNKYDDISLMSILRQPYSISSIDMNSIAKIRVDHKEQSLYDCLLLSQDKKIISFLENFEMLCQYAKEHSPYDLLKKIYEVTEYPLFVTHLVNGEQRKANLDLLLEVIKQKQEQTPYLSDLLEELMQAADIAPAQVSYSHDVVEFMTIHKSKGLEFPIVFVSQMHKQFNMQDSKEKIMIDKKLGFALKPRIFQSGETLSNVIAEYENSYRDIIACHQLDESVNEEMRILYVALTRASQKLILTGVMKSIDEIVDIQEKLLINEDPDIPHHKGNSILLYHRLRKTNNYLSWILATILRHQDIIEQCLSIDELKESIIIKRVSL